MYDKLTLLGRVGNVQEVKRVGESSVLNFSLAVSRYAGPDKDRQTVWYNVAWWNTPGAFPYVEKGKTLLVEGQLAPEVRVYQKADGAWAASYSVTALSVVFAGGAAKADDVHENANSVSAAQESDDIPF